MGVYISKLMDMPEHCYECLLRQGNCCLLLYEAIPPTVPLTRLDDCPLIEIPTPHGRLIDKDELLSHLKKDPLFDLVERYGVSGVIESRPTILEAEGRTYTIQADSETVSYKNGENQF